jgi:hypothetical protein
MDFRNSKLRLPSGEFKPQRILTVLAVFVGLSVCSLAESWTHSAYAKHAPSPDAYTARIEDVKYMGWDAIRLSNGLVSLILVPDIGGRAIQLQLGERSIFFVNPALAGKVLSEAENNPQTGVWNYGGDKLWPAPEGWLDDDQWPSVPYYVLDGSRYKSEVVANGPEEVAVRVTSPADPRTGVQFARTFHVYSGTTRVRVDELMRNISQRQIRWGMWHLVQHDAADATDSSKPNPDLYMYVPLNRHSVFTEGYTKLYGDVRHPSDEVLDGGKMLRVHYLYRVGKVGIDSDGGWYAVVNGQKKTCFLESFKYFPGEEYPDNSSVESWNDGPGIVHRNPFDQILKDDPKETPYFFESEVMSPYISLEPAEEHVFTVEWAVTDAPAPIVESRRAGVVSEPFTVAPSGASVVLKGTFGVFRPGSLEATFFDERGVILQQKNLQDVDPRTAVRLSQSVALPPATFRISLCIRNASGENLGYLGNVILRHPS